MQALWVSVMDNVNCRSKLTDVVSLPQKCGKAKCFSSGKENWDAEVQGKGNFEGKVLQHMGNNPVCKVLFRPNFPSTQFVNITNQDPSRKIIETIFRKALTDSAKASTKIKRVFKVKNSVHILERFEKYREKVMKKAYKQCKRNPRDLVDGNELLRFHGTVMTCGNRSTHVSELCKDPFCRVCRVIQSNFGTDHRKKNGVQLSTSSEVVCDHMVALRKVKNAQRAVIVCRTIAGRVAGNLVDGAYNDEFDSFTSGEDHLTVISPCAVLPCFVIVFT